MLNNIHSEGVLLDKDGCSQVSGTASSGTSIPETISDDASPIQQNERKIRIGSQYQAVCPPFIPESGRKPEALKDHALIVWKPTSAIPDAKLEEYITFAKEKYGYESEQALAMLFWHNYNLERTVIDLRNFPPYREEWPAEDNVLFEQAVKFHGKNYHLIK